MLKCYKSNIPWICNTTILEFYSPSSVVYRCYSLVFCLLISFLGESLSESCTTSTPWAVSTLDLTGLHSLGWNKPVISQHWPDWALPQQICAVSWYQGIELKSPLLSVTYEFAWACACMCSSINNQLRFQRVWFYQQSTMVSNIFVLICNFCSWRRAQIMVNCKENAIFLEKSKWKKLADNDFETTELDAN